MGREKTISLRILGKADSAVAAFNRVRQESNATVSAISEGMSRASAAQNQQANDFAKLGVKSSRDIKRELDDVAQAYKRLRTDGKVSVNDLARAKQALIQKVQRLKKESNATFSKMTRDMERAKEAERQLAGAFETLGVRSLRDVKNEVRAAEKAYKHLQRSGNVSVKDLARAKLQLIKRTKSLRKETGLWTSSIGRARSAWASLAAVGFSFAKGFAVFGEFSQRMAEVNTLTDMSATRFAALSEEITKLSKQVPQSADQLAAAEYDILSAGVALENSTTVLKLSAKAAVAGVTDTKTAVNVGLGVINAYGLGIGELKDVYDTLFSTVKQGVTTFPELAQSLGETLPTAKAAGVSYQDVAAAVAALTKAGIRTPQATTALRGAINALAAPAPEAKKRLEEMGIVWRGLLPTLEDIAKRNLSIDQMRMIVPDVEARTGVLALTQNLTGLKDIMLQMESAGGATQAAYNKMKDTPFNKLQMLKNEFSAMAIEAGEWVIQNKELVKTLVATGGVLYAVNLTRGSLGTMKVALDLMKGSSIGATGALKGLGAAAVIAFSTTMVIKATQEYIKMREAIEDAEKAQNRMLNVADKVKGKNADFKDVEIPATLSGLGDQELVDLRRNLAKSKAYWTAHLDELSVKARETDFFGGLTDEAEQAVQESYRVELRLKGLMQTLGQVQTRFKASATPVMPDISKITPQIEKATGQITEMAGAQKEAAGTAKGFAKDQKAAGEATAAAMGKAADKTWELVEAIRQLKKEKGSIPTDFRGSNHGGTLAGLASALDDAERTE